MDGTYGIEIEFLLSPILNAPAEISLLDMIICCEVELRGVITTITVKLSLPTISVPFGDSNSIAEKPEKNDDNKKLLPPLTPMPPLENVGGYCVIKERMTQAFRYFKELTELNVLAQVWAPVPNEESSGIGVGSSLGAGVRGFDDGGCLTGDGKCERKA
ncbi:Protein NLP7-like protein [Vigna angularis]|uniref:Protein NLP7-like protein n=1 Tax=Phaseolus angularis TaxID=3914 RepID=A0A8T0KVT3_PHAAN|nr:Protein NLP7-like protein [Vigna angularis]